MYDDTNDFNPVLRHLRPAKRSSEEHSRPIKNAYNDYYRRVFFDKLRNRRERARQTGTDTWSTSLPTPFSEREKARSVTITDDRIYTDYNLSHYEPDVLHLPEDSTLSCGNPIRRITLDLGSCAPPVKAIVHIRTCGTSRADHKDHFVLLGNYENTTLTTPYHLLELEQTGSVTLTSPKTMLERPTYLQLVRAEYYYTHVEELNALFPRIKKNIYFVPRDTAKQLILANFTQDVPINIAKFLYIASVGGMFKSGAARFLSSSEYFYHFLLFSRMVENKLIEVPQLYKYQFLQQHQDAPNYSKPSKHSIEFSFPAFDYHADAPCYG